MNESTFTSMNKDAADRVPLPRRNAWLRLGLPILILAGVATLLFTTGWDAWRPRRDVAAIPVGVRTVEIDAEESDRGPSAVAVQAPGWVEADPFDIFVSALTDGVIRDILVLEGDRVVAGQKVASLYDEEAVIEVARLEAEVMEHHAHLQNAKAVLHAAETEFRELIDLDQMVAVTRAEETRLAAVVAGFPAKRASLEAARAEKVDEYERKRQVVESGAVPAGTVERLRIRIQAIDAQLDALDAEEEAARASREAASARLDAAVRSRKLTIDETLALESARVGIEIERSHLDAAQASLDAAKLRLERCDIRTPVDGVVIERLTSPGSRVSFGDGPHTAHVIHIYDPQKLQVRADIPLADAAKVGVGQTAEIIIDLLPDTVFQGVVTRFVHRADVAKNTVEAKVRILDPSPLLKPDMLARVRILEAEVGEASTSIRTRPRVFAPRKAVQDGYAWVVGDRKGDHGIAMRKAIEVGDRTVDGWIEIVKGLRPGDLIIVDDAPVQDEPIRITVEGEVTS